MSRILIVEDDPLLAEMLLEFIQSNTGHDADCACNGKEGVAQWQASFSSEQPYALILTDLHMPIMSGEAMIREIRKQDEDVEILILTSAGAYSEAYGLLRKYQISGFFRKPLSDFEGFAFLVDQTLEKHFLKLHIKEQNKSLLQEIENRNKAYEKLEQEMLERKKLEQERSILFQAVEQSPNRVFITDKRGKIQYTNKAFETITGYSREEALNQTPALIKSGKHPREFYEKLWETILKGDVFSAEFINKKKCGTLYYEEEVISPIFDEKGELIRFLSVAKNVTKTRELELMEQSKLVSLGLVATGVAHEVNNPNTWVRGNAQTLQFYWKHFAPALEEYAHAHPELKVGRKDFSFIAQDAPHLLEQIIEGSTRIQAIVDALLVFGHKGEHYVPTNLVHVIDQALSASNSRLKPLHHFKFEISEKQQGHMLVLGKPAQLLQVMIHLLQNAVESMKNTPFAEKVLIIRLSSQEKDYCIQVQDYGTGIEEQNLLQIFEPFFTTKSVGEGMGLGLHICNIIIRNHKGSLSVQNHPEGGSIFEIRLPKINTEA